MIHVLRLLLGVCVWWGRKTVVPIWVVMCSSSIKGGVGYGLKKINTEKVSELIINGIWYSQGQGMGFRLAHRKIYAL